MKHNNQDNDLDRQIEVNLRRVFQEKISEPVPDKFLQLLKELKDQEDQHDRA
ncbi:NepR family anti-sigma factor [Albirhodobacter sp. R86504]|uniref:NepR family anti-sigma factor n=1 Tax=Albirhodobacter sp. R86504 TaxID=3093848 RepID=UPI0036728C77